MNLTSQFARLRGMIRDRSQREGESIAATSNRRAKIHRSLFALLTAVISSVWVGPIAACVWYGVVLAYEFGFLPWCLAKFVQSLGKARRDEARRRSAFLTFGGSVLFAVGWVPAWIIGGDEAGYFAALWLACALMQASVYNAKDSIGFYAWVVPVVIPAFTVPFITHTSLLIPLACLLATVRVLVTTHISQQDRSALMASMADDRLKRRAAEDASLAKSQFLATMSHELRTPLNAVIGYAEILEEDLGAKELESEASDAARIRRAARSLLGLINEVLDFSKIEAGRLELTPTLTDVPSLIQEVVATTAHLAQANNNVVEVTIAPAVTTMELDGQRLRQCILNLVSNACKFTNDGRVSIVATLKEDRAGGQLQVTVADTGRGIAPADQARLFQPFVQVDGSTTRQQDGTGLGLVITRRLAQLMGGDVAMESAPGVGSRFSLRVALQRPAAAIAAEVGAAPLVLIIEDDAAVRDIARRALTHLPLRVLCAETGAQGLKCAASEKPALIVLDIHLPDQSGWDVLESLKADAAVADVPVLIHSIADDRVRSAAMGANGHLIKPVNRDQFAAAVAHWAMGKDVESKPALAAAAA